MSDALLYQPSNASESGIISPFLTLTATGIERNLSGTSTEAQLAFWFSIAAGELWGSPSWGHPFKARAFMTGSANELVVAEMQITRKLRADMPSLNVNGIKAEFESSDLIIFTIFYIDDGVQASYRGNS
jgi:hypothetical protein